MAMRIRDRKLSRIEASIMIASYFAYLGVRFWLFRRPDLFSHS